MSSVLCVCVCVGGGGGGGGGRGKGEGGRGKRGAQYHWDITSTVGNVQYRGRYRYKYGDV